MLVTTPPTPGSQPTSTTSIDGGQTFGPQSYANPAKTAVDAITGATNVIGPASDDQAAVNAQTDARFGYGNQMGLAVADGQVFPIWAGNFFGPTGDPNDSFFNTTTGAVDAYPLNIWYQPMTIAAGPRIISSTMGPVVDGNLSGSAIDLPQFVPARRHAFPDSHHLRNSDHRRPQPEHHQPRSHRVDDLSQGRRPDHQADRARRHDRDPLPESRRHRPELLQDNLLRFGHPVARLRDSALHRNLPAAYKA